MPTSAEQINALIAEATALKTFFESVRDDIETDVSAAQAQFGTLAGDLRDVVGQMNYFNAVWDEDAPENPVENGSFQTLAGLLDKAPRGSMVSITIPGGKVISIPDDFTTLKHHYTRISTASGGQPARLQFPTTVDGGGLNRVNRLSLLYGSALELVDLELEIMPKADGVAGWSPMTGAAIVAEEQNAAVKMKGCSLIGREGSAFVNATDAIMDLILSSVSADGDLRIIGNSADGLFRLIQKSISVTNGASLLDGGTPGVNYLTV